MDVIELLNPIHMFVIGLKMYFNINKIRFDVWLKMRNEQIKYKKKNIQKDILEIKISRS